MTNSYHLITYALLLLISLSSNIAARPFNVVNSIDYTCDEVTGTKDIISLAAIKSGGGPSPGGKGHDFPTANYFGNIKNSGPSPGGEGHEFTKNTILGENKNSGPSPGGEGHGFHDAETFGNIKNSGPSSGGKNSGPRAGGKGHVFHSSVETLGNTLDSGPCHEGKGHLFAIDESLVDTTCSRPPWANNAVRTSQSLWDLKNSGPSHGGEGH